MSIWVGGNVVVVKKPQAVLPTKNLTLSLLPASPRPSFIPFSSDAIGVLWRYRIEREWTPMASYRAEWVNHTTPFWPWLQYTVHSLGHLFQIFSFKKSQKCYESWCGVNENAILLFSVGKNEYFPASDVGKQWRSDAGFVGGGWESRHLARSASRSWVMYDNSLHRGWFYITRQF